MKSLVGKAIYGNKGIDQIKQKIILLAISGHSMENFIGGNGLQKIRSNLYFKHGNKKYYIRGFDNHADSKISEEGCRLIDYYESKQEEKIGGNYGGKKNKIRKTRKKYLKKRQRKSKKRKEIIF